MPSESLTYSSVPLPVHPRHLVGRSLQRLALVRDAARDLPPSVDEHEALLTSAARGASEDEGLLRLAAWHDAWSSPRPNLPLAVHHLHAWLRLAFGDHGRLAWQRLTHAPVDPSGELAAVFKSLPQDQRQRLGEGALHHPHDPVWWPLQTLLVHPSPPSRQGWLIGWYSLQAVMDDARHPAATWVLDSWQRALTTPSHNAWPDRHEMLRHYASSVWRLLLSAPEGTLAPQLMSVWRTPWRSPKGEAKEAKEVGEGGSLARMDGATVLAMAFSEAMSDQAPMIGSAHHPAQAAWWREARAWIDAGGRLPHAHPFSLPLSAGWPLHVPSPTGCTFDQAVTRVAHEASAWMRAAGAPSWAAWLDAWNLLVEHEARAQERERLRATVEMALDEQGGKAGHLKTRPRL